MKRMWTQKEIEDLAGKIDIDDTISDTSENPVQNKVIYNALEKKQDKLPSTAEQIGKFLKVGSDGLEWASIKNGTYLHILRIQFNRTGSSRITIGEFSIVNNDPVAYTTPQRLADFASWLKSAGYDSQTNELKVGGFQMIIPSGTDFVSYNIQGIYSTDGSSVICHYGQYTFAGTINGTAVEFAGTYSNKNDGSINVVDDIVVPL